MFFMRSRRHHLESIQQKEALITVAKQELDATMDEDMARLNTLNKILGNGIALKLYSVSAGRHGH